MDSTTFCSALLFWSAVHFVGDFGLQSAWMAMKKCPKNYDPTVDCAGPWEVLLYHCMTYTSAFVVMAKLSGADANLCVFAVIFLAHFLVDALKARDILVKTIWLDQTLHLLTLLPLILLGWL